MFSDSAPAQQTQNSYQYDKLLLFFGFIIITLCIVHRWLRRKRCKSTAKIDGKTVIVTGGNAGIGKETAKDLARRGGRVIIACRDTKKGLEAANEIRTEVPLAVVIVKQLDLSSFASIRRFAKDILTTESYIHILINNAGIAGSPKWKTEDGFEMQFGVNHLGHFLLTLLLLDKMKESAPSRIINVSSSFHYFGSVDLDDIKCDRDCSPLKSYSRSKLANILFTRELAKRLRGTGVTAYSLHPGLVHTDISRHLDSMYSEIELMFYRIFSSILLVSPDVGSQTSIYCAIDESLAEESGHYYNDCSRVEPAAHAKDDEMAKRLWETSEKWVGLSS